MIGQTEQKKIYVHNTLISKNDFSLILSSFHPCAITSITLLDQKFSNDGTIANFLALCDFRKSSKLQMMGSSKSVGRSSIIASRRKRSIVAFTTVVFLESSIYVQSVKIVLSRREMRLQLSAVLGRCLTCVLSAIFGSFGKRGLFWPSSEWYSCVGTGFLNLHVAGRDLPESGLLKEAALMYSLTILGAD
jgi:hypothetical protein